MKALLISDFHIGSQDKAFYIRRINQLTQFIRSEIGNEPLFVFVLGDIIDCGKVEYFELANVVFDHFRSELNGYDYRLYFVPGNHDYCNKSREAFDLFIRNHQSSSTFLAGTSMGTVKNDAYNFLLWDSISLGDYSKPGRVDLSVIRSAVDASKHNILLLHHSLLFEDGSFHSGVVNTPEVIDTLVNLGVKFVFHGHTHATRVFDVGDSLHLIGAGSFTVDTSKDSATMTGFDNSNNQFNVVSLSEGHLESVVNCRYMGDLGQYMSFTLFPPQIAYADPLHITKEAYDAPPSYMPRKVFPHASSNEDLWQRMFNRDDEKPLQDACERTKRLLLISDAGMGKTTELRQLTADINQGRSYPVYISLSEYGGTSIENMLPARYTTMNPATLMLILDGYDEVGGALRAYFKRNLKTYVEKNPQTRIVVSMRSTFVPESTGLFSGFEYFDLLELDRSAINSFLQKKGIDVKRFGQQVNARNLDRLLPIPFYLQAIADVFLADESLPTEAQLIDRLISITIASDSSKYEYTFDIPLTEIQHEVKTALTRLAYTMQLLSKTSLHLDEYQEFIKSEERKLVELSGICSKRGEMLSFSHNNFQEYLAAKHLASLSLTDLLNRITLQDGSSVDARWINTLLFTLQLRSDNDLIDWLAEHDIMMLVKAEPSRVSEEIRYRVLQACLEAILQNYTWFDREICDERELAIFSQSSEGIDLMLKEVIEPASFHSQYFALTIILHMTNLYGKYDEIRDALVACHQNEKTRPHERRIALHALAALGLHTPVITQDILSRYEHSQDIYDRLGACEYLIASGQADECSEYFLNGLLLYRNTENMTGLFTIEKTLKEMTNPTSISKILKWYVEHMEDHFFRDSEIFEAVSISAVPAYKNGHSMLFDNMVSVLMRAADVFQDQAVAFTLAFFKSTGTLEKAFEVVLGSEINFLRLIIYRFIACDPALEEYMYAEYLKGKYTSVFEEYVDAMLNTTPNFVRFSQAIEEKTGRAAVGREFIDYDAQNKVNAQKYFDSLFDKGKAMALLSELLEGYGTIKLTFAELRDHTLFPDISFSDSIIYLRRVLTSSGIDDAHLVADFYELIDWERYAYAEIYFMLSHHDKLLFVSTEQRGYILNWFSTLLETVDLATAEKENSITADAFYLLFLREYFQFPCSESLYIDLISISPFHISASFQSADKYALIEKHVAHEKIRARIIENLQKDIPTDVAVDHFYYCTKHSIPDARKLAVAFCLDKKMRDYPKQTAVEYLYKVFGCELILSDVLPHAGEELLTIITHFCREKDERLESAIIRQLKISPNNLLLSRLIAMNSKKGLLLYAEEIRGKNETPCKGMDGVTEAISSIDKPELLPELLELVAIRFSPGFKDISMKSLWNCLYESIVACGRNDFNLVFYEIESLKEKSAGSPDILGFCSRVLMQLTKEKKHSLIRIWTSYDIKQELQAIT